MNYGCGKTLEIDFPGSCLNGICETLHDGSIG